MTGFAGWVAPAGSTIDPRLLAAMADAVAPLGPDRHDRWSNDQAGLVHALLRTTFEDKGDRQPRSFDGEVWLAGDVRIDGREGLLSRLRLAGRTVTGDAPDSDFVLHAYHAWGEACIERLIGDFSFAIWDGRARTLFCARDQLGVIPFYYAPLDGGLIFGNAMQALLVHRALDRTLNRSAVGDYLLFGYSLDPEAGFYRSVRRLPAAHCLTWRAGKLNLRRYWTPPEPSPTDPREDPRAVVDRFAQVFAEAVSDRLRAPRVACMLSGGLDSGLVTGFASRNAAATRIDAYSLGSDWIIADDEREWAMRSARPLGVRFHAISSEDTNIPPVGGSYWREAPEPRFEMRGFSYQGIVRAAVDDGARVLLSGMGGDALVNRGLSDWAARLRRGDLVGMIPEVIRYWRRHRRRPPLRSAWRWGRRAASPHAAPLDADFAAEQNLEQRWIDFVQTSAVAAPFRSITETTFWSEMFCAAHPESLGLPIKLRHPFFDVRLFAEVMKLPATPWQFDKAILRSIGEGILPPDVLERPKTPFGRSTAYAAARHGLAPWMSELAHCSELDGFVDRTRLARSVATIETMPQHLFHQAITLPGSLAAWLRQAK